MRTKNIPISQILPVIRENGAVNTAHYNIVYTVTIYHIINLIGAGYTFTMAGIIDLNIAHALRFVGFNRARACYFRFERAQITDYRKTHPDPVMMDLDFS